MKKSIIALASALCMVFSVSLAGVSVAQASESLTGGAKGGSYETSGYQLVSAMKRYGHEMTYLKSKGSSQNLDRVFAGEAAVGIAQLDDYASFIKRRPEAADSVEVIGSLFPECVYIVAKEGGKVDSDQDLMKEGIKIAVGGKGSGSATTWDYMVSLEKGFAKATPVWKGGARTLGKVNSGQIDAFMWVTNPNNLNHKLLTAARASGLKFVEVTDWDLNDKLPTTGEPVYSFEGLKLEKGFMADGYDTICTSSVVVANSDSDEDMLEDLSGHMLKYSDQLSK